VESRGRWHRSRPGMSTTLPLTPPETKSPGSRANCPRRLVIPGLSEPRSERHRWNRSSLPLQISKEHTPEDALQYRLQYEAVEVIRGLHPSPTFYLQNAGF
jgi:hypothetical protein